MANPVRFSHLKAYGRSAAHGKYARQNETEETRAMELGTAVHALLFNTANVCGYPGPQRRGKDYEAFAAKHEGYEILTMAEYDKARRMADSVLACPLAVPLIQGVVEETLLFRWMGLDCRATPDVRGTDFITELKTSKSADPMQFIWQAKRMHYHAQMRFQQYGCEARGYKVRDHWIVCVESDAPHPVTVFHVEPEVLLEGEKLLTLWAERMRNCESSGEYPAYTDCAVPLVWPKDEFALEYEEEAA